MLAPTLKLLGCITERKRAKIENPYLNVHLKINMNLQI